MSKKIGVSLAVLFCITASAEKKPKPQPVSYANTRTYPASCDAVWVKIVPVIAKNALVPESSDRMGGLMRLRYTRGDMRGSLQTISKFTTDEGRPGGMHRAFRINGGSITLVDSAGSCVTTAQIEYSVFSASYFGRYGSNGWVGLQSNGLLEAVILDNLRMALGL